LLPLALIRIDKSPARRSSISPQEFVGVVCLPIVTSLSTKAKESMMPIRDLMTKPVKVVRPDETIRNAARKMGDAGIGFIPVCSGDRLVGVITDRDLAVRAVAEALDANQTRVEELMTDEIVYCFDDDDVATTAAMMKQKKIRRILIVDRQKRLVGVVSIGDLAREAREESTEVLEEISESPPTT
jgi:CBS domain-containing protein